MPKHPQCFRIRRTQSPPRWPRRIAPGQSRLMGTAGNCSLRSASLSDGCRSTSKFDCKCSGCPRRCQPIVSCCRSAGRLSEDLRYFQGWKARFTSNRRRPESPAHPQLSLRSTPRKTWRACRPSRHAPTCANHHDRLHRKAGPRAVGRAGGTAAGTPLITPGWQLGLAIEGPFEV